MTCSEAEKMIPVFLDDSLDNKNLGEFIEHMNSCPDCKEELTIQFLIKVGMKRLEDGDTFNLQGELDGMLSNARHRMKVRHSLQVLADFLQLLVVFAIMIIIFLLIFI